MSTLVWAYLRVDFRQDLACINQMNFCWVRLHMFRHMSSLLYPYLIEFKFMYGVIFKNLLLNYNYTKLTIKPQKIACLYTSLVAKQ